MVLSRGGRAVHSMAVCCGRQGPGAEEFAGGATGAGAWGSGGGSPVLGVYCVYGSVLPRQLLRAVTLELDQLLRLLAPCVARRLRSPSLLAEWTYLHQQLLDPAQVDALRRPRRASSLLPPEALAGAGGGGGGGAASPGQPGGRGDAGVGGGGGSPALGGGGSRASPAQVGVGSGVGGVGGVGAGSRASSAQADGGGGGAPGAQLAAAVAAMAAAMAAPSGLVSGATWAEGSSERVQPAAAAAPGWPWVALPPGAVVVGAHALPSGSADTSSAHQRLTPAEASRLVHGSAVDHQEELAAIEVLEKIGEGGYGEVYRGQYNGTEVAIKIVYEPNGGGALSTALPRARSTPMVPLSGPRASFDATSTPVTGACRNLHDAFELTVSVSVTHPHIVAVLTFFTGQSARAAARVAAGWEEARSCPRDMVLSRGGRAVHSMAVCCGRQGPGAEEFAGGATGAGAWGSGGGSPVLGVYCVYGSVLPRQLLRAVTLELDQLLRLLAPCVARRLRSPSLLAEWTYLHQQLLDPAQVDALRRPRRASSLLPPEALAGAGGGGGGGAASPGQPGGRGDAGVGGGGGSPALGGGGSRASPAQVGVGSGVGGVGGVGAGSRASSAQADGGGGGAPGAQLAAAVAAMAAAMAAPSGLVSGATWAEGSSERVQPAAAAAPGWPWVALPPGAVVVGAHALPSGSADTSSAHQRLTPAEPALPYARHPNSCGFTAKLSDFGLVRLMEPCGPEGRLAIPQGVQHGTLTHMAPEVLSNNRNLPHDSALDLYAFGIMMWQICCGGRLYPGVSNSDIPARVVREGLRPRFPPTVPPEYRSLAESCWAPSPGARPSAAEVVGALKGLMGLGQRLAGQRRYSALPLQGDSRSMLPQDAPPQPQGPQQPGWQQGWQQQGWLHRPQQQAWQQAQHGQQGQGQQGQGQHDTRPAFGPGGVGFGGPHAPRLAPQGPAGGEGAAAAQDAQATRGSGGSGGRAVGGVGSSGSGGTARGSGGRNCSRPESAALRSRSQSYSAFPVHIL
ncbi:putative LIM domain-containing serine/threonine-protein kinase [Tetrabaena socialis]|uniref:Putative LIM domain-containing serine/threonine-protein kinase n=1 Tax=Tetrabaena socialis TaxID=47790 RepID=A0A2J8AIF0_9CHLO|nr:putative LIM domain-containing serine/threonine-protein kinase [Tetrabaena socialis]|eukprot:PNH12294.1 putative LIM domain-containing serine/threonine-protein kinase [Tetrabaena socialis]